LGREFKVLMFERMHAVGTNLLESCCDLIYAQSLEESSLLNQVADVDAIIIRANGAVTRKLIEAAKQLKVIGRHGVGIDAIDLEAAREKGVRVVFTPTANTESVAEHFVVLALILAKKVRLADIALRAGNWNARYELIGTELYGKTLGILGFGRIGQQTAKICHNGFQMKILYYDVTSYPQMENDIGATRVNPEAIFSGSDFISVNLPLIPATAHFINSKFLRIMKSTAFLINMARGPVWNESDIVEALKKGQIAGAGSDVFETEPVSPDNPLLKLDNFVGTPHMSAHTKEGMMRMSMVAKDVLAVLRGQEPEFQVV
jgi:D-3-phosphoglycerate dehydrogenase / 2-oxoglutarate reductase